jgi:predicted phage tail component-like protein
MNGTIDATLNGVTLSSAVPEALILRPTRPLVGRRRHVTEDVPGRAGSYIFTEEPGDRIITLELDMQAASFEDRRAACRALADWADVGTQAPLILDDEPDRYLEVILDDDPAPDEWLVAATITLRFLASPPYALASELSTETDSLSGSPDGDSFTIPDEVSAEPIIEITPTNGTITAFTLELNGEALSWSGLIPDDNTLTINAIADVITTGPNGDTMLTGAFDVDLVSMADISGDFPILLEGSNTDTLTWTGTATAVTVAFTWRRRYR